MSGPVNRFLQDDESAGIRSLQTSIVIKLCQTLGNGLKLLANIIFAETPQTYCSKTLAQKVVTFQQKGNGEQ